MRDRDLPLLRDSDGLALFWPHISPRIRDAVAQQLETRWIGQGPRVDEFENAFSRNVLMERASSVAVSSGTAALHLAYRLALREESGGELGSLGEVIAPVFTCTATNLPWLYLGLKIRWADVDPESMNISPDSVASLISPRTRAIVVVHYGGYPADMAALTRIARKHGIPVIEDCAQALGATVDSEPVGTIGDYGAFSFQAIKHITTGDGGLIAMQDRDLVSIAKRLRWFGIDREGKQNGVWENDVREIGFKYQMTDISAAMGLAGLDDLGEILAKRRSLLNRYVDQLGGVPGVRVLAPQGAASGRFSHAAWLATVVFETPDARDRVRAALREHRIEANAVHFRNDMYSVFRDHASGECPAMDELDGRYLCLPLHTRCMDSDIDRVCEVVAQNL